MKHSLELLSYVIYLPISILLTTYVSHHLFKHGKIFMLDIFKQKTEIALATNKLLKIGFYLVNLGFALRIIKVYLISDYRDLIETLSSKIGGFSIYLGVIMLVFIFLFLKGRKASKKQQTIVTRKV